MKRLSRAIVALTGRRDLRRLPVLAIHHVSHWCLLRLWSYTFEITVLLIQRTGRRICCGPVVASACS
jgi:hypothetical protein